MHLRYVDAMISLHLFAILASTLVAETSGGVARSKGSTCDGASSVTLIPTTGCPNQCGDLTFDFPFGIGLNCSRSSDFELTCDNTTKPPKLFMCDGITQVINNITIVTTENMDSFSEHSVSIDFTHTISMNSSAAPVFWSLSLKSPGNSFYAYYPGLSFLGCDFEVHWVNPPVNTTAVAARFSCTSLCPDGEHTDMTAAAEYCSSFSGTGCCSIMFSDGLDIGVAFVSLAKLKFVRHGTADPTKVHHNLSFVWDTINVTINQAAANWNIIDQPTCARAVKDKTTYACVSRSSICQDDSDFEGYGYGCKCRKGYTGNPYILDGCKSDNGYNPFQRKNNCTRQCGSINISFPFGLEEGCFAREEFHLDCTNKTTSPTLLFAWDAGYQVTNIYVDHGLIEYISPNTNNAEIGINTWDGEHDLYLSSAAAISMKWVAAQLTCEEAIQNKSGYACVSPNSECKTIRHTGDYVGYRCNCKSGYQGNPYIQNGCVDINECLQRNICPEMCNNTEGSYTCNQCLYKTEYDPVKGHCIVRKRQNLLLGVAIGISAGVGILLLCLSGVFIIHRWRMDIQKQLRKKHFLKNKGLLLEQLISSDEKQSDNKIFSLEELQKATNNFDPTRILGSGGHGMVYKGILSDQRVVAIKKPKVIVEGEINQFINEVAILSQINHRNIVKLLGCCLETEVPLLVYDFVPNGSLFKIIHDDNCNQEFSLSWDDCLRIATEAAGALCYLHSAASVSVFHRDVKSSNILLDGSYTAKVSDFGASRLIPIDQTHVITNVQGTFGYLDPEYYHTGQLNEKSDVYSFGVVLLELLLRMEPIFTSDSGSKRNLSNYFFCEIRTRPITEIVAPEILEQATEDEVNTVASLAEECLRLKGEERPAMKEVEMKLQLLRNKGLRSDPSKNGLRSCNVFPDGSYEIQEPPTTRLAVRQCQSLEIDGTNRANVASSSCYELEQEFMSSATLPR